MSKRHVSKGKAARSPVGVARLSGATMAIAITAAPAVACGGLVGENGTIQLTRTTTLAAYHDGVERYVTSFEFSGQGKEVGSIVPLARRADEGASAAATGRCSGSSARSRRRSARRLAAAAQSRGVGAGAGAARRRKIDALDITVLQGRRRRGRQVGDRARVPAHARRARDARLLRAPQPDLHGRALRRVACRQLGQNTGDGTPIMLTIPTTRAVGAAAHPRPRARAAPRSSRPTCSCSPTTEPKLLAGGRGLSLDRNEPANASLLSDLRSDKGMGWVPAAHVVHVPAARRAGRRARLRPRDQHQARRGAVAHRRGRDRGARARRSTAQRRARAVAARRGRRRSGIVDVRARGAVRSPPPAPRSERRHEAPGPRRASRSRVAIATVLAGYAVTDAAARRRADRARRPGS